MRGKLPSASGYEVCVAAVLGVAGASLLVLLWLRMRPYDVDAAVAATYVLLAAHDFACAPTREYEDRNWVSLPLVMDVTTQYVDLGLLVGALARRGATLVAEAVTDNPNGRNLVVRVPKALASNRLAELGVAAAVALCAIYVAGFAAAV